MEEKASREDESDRPPKKQRTTEYPNASDSGSGPSRTQSADPDDATGQGSDGDDDELYERTVLGSDPVLSDFDDPGNTLPPSSPAQSTQSFMSSDPDF